MWEEILKALSVYVSAMVKFILGPIGGKAAGLSIITTMIVTAAAMMTVVVAVTYFGKFIREKILDRFYTRKKTQAKPKNRKWVFLVRKYGLFGISFLTPLLLTPLGGAILAFSFFSSNREKILLYMFISASFWSTVLTCAVYFGYDAVVEMVKRFSDY